MKELLTNFLFSSNDCRKSFTFHNSNRKCPTFVEKTVLSLFVACRDHIEKVILNNFENRENFTALFKRYRLLVCLLSQLQG